MGLKADIDEVAKVWRQSPWRVRLFLALSLLLASSSIASLSETIFKWRGFLLDGLTFYRHYITGPTIEFAQQVFHYDFPTGFADFLVVTALISTATIRVIMFNVRQRSMAIIYAYEVVAGNFLYLFLIARHRNMMPPYPWIAGVMYALFILFVLFIARGATRILVVSYLSIPPIAVVLLAAISAGISRAA